MNYLQLLAACVFFGAVVVLGLKIKIFLGGDESRLNTQKSLAFAHCYILGYTVLAGIFILFSLLHLYRAPVLISSVLLCYAFLLDKKVRIQGRSIFSIKNFLSLPVLIFVGMLAFLFFKNYYYLVVGDTHNIYLFVQKLWLAHGTSLVGDQGYNIGIYTPHANAIFYSLGISLFGQETLFAQLVHVSWKIILMMLIFGYTSYRLNGYYGLIAVTFALFDEHIFYSGANACVVINCAVVSLAFAGAYLFWEAREEDNSFLLVLAMIFLSQLMVNKYQLIFVMAIIFVIGWVIQKNRKEKICAIVQNKNWLTGFVVVGLLSSLWFVKNLILTGDPVFPALAGKMGVFNWTAEMEQTFAQVFGGPGINMLLKYLSYFFVWPGVIPSKIVFLAIVFLPVIFGVALMRKNFSQQKMLELVYWLGISLLALMSICMTAFTDPRAYRYLIAIFAYTSIFLIYYGFNQCLGIKRKVLKGPLSILLFLLIFFPLFIKRAPPLCHPPTVKENLDVMLNRIHSQEIMERFYPENLGVQEQIDGNKERFERAAWDIGTGGYNRRSAFWLPTRPQVGLWATTLIQWDSYKDADQITKDLSDYGLEYIMRTSDSGLTFIPIEEYAKEMADVERFPKTRFYNYGFPKELADIQY